MARPNREQDPRIPVRGIEKPPSREFVVFRAALKEVGRVVVELTGPIQHPLIVRMRERLVGNTQPPPNETPPPDSKPS